MKGIGASKGYGIGYAVIKREISKVEKTACDSVDMSKAALVEAIQTCELALMEDQKKEVGGDIFAAHLMMLKDPEYIGAIHKVIETEKVTPAYAVQSASNQFAAMFEAMDNDYFRERAIDIKDIGRRLVDILLGNKAQDFNKDQMILIGHDITPSDTSKLNKEKTEGFITAIGGETSHSAIIARTLGIPAIMGVTGILDTVKEGDFIIIDGYSGEVYINPDSKTIERYKEKQTLEHTQNQRLLLYKDKASVTACGHTIEIGANIASPDDVEPALSFGAEGVGLFRSEFIFMNRDKAPSEAEQFEIYKAVLSGMDKRPVIIRTLDAGGDKHIPYLNVPDEMNPFLGYRAIRICLEEEVLFMTQLRALLRASVFGNLKIMFPMISSVEEIRAAKAVVEKAKASLTQEGILFAEEIEIGIMIEIPAAAIASDLLAQEVDFFSIGTNDLIQYSTAVDRMNEKIKHLYTAYHPAVLRLIHMTIKNASQAGIWTGMCGSVAGNPNLFPILIAMGLHEFSMSPNQILRCREIASQYDLETLNKHLSQVMSFHTATDVKDYLINHFGTE